MTINDFFLICAAIFPAIVLSVYIFKKDKVEKEPILFLLQLLCLGAIACLPAAFIAGMLLDGIDAAMLPFGRVIDGQLFLSGMAYYIYNFLSCFVGIALVEEGIKWLFLVLGTKKSENFNSFFDGVVYAVFISLGFAALENVMYVLENGWMNALMRAILSVPGHMFFGVIMGYYYSRWHILQKAKSVEQKWISDGNALPEGKKPFRTKRSARLSLIMPTLAHGFYDFCCMVDSTVFVLGFYVFVAFLYAYCFSKIKAMSNADAPSRTYVELLLRRKYGGD